MSPLPARPVALALASRLRRTLLESRLRAVDIATTAFDPGAGDLPTLVITDRATAPSLGEGPGLWIEILAEPGHDGPADRLAGFGRYRPLDLALEGAALIRLVAPDGDVSAALDPGQWGTIIALAERAPERISSLLDGYLARTPERLAELRTLAGANEREALARAAHAWKGAAAGVAADRLADALLRLEFGPGDEAVDPLPRLAVIEARADAADRALHGADLETIPN